MTNEDLIQLREVFRKEFQEHDFCIGEQQVERVFRQLLGEEEPEVITPKREKLPAHKLDELAHMMGYMNIQDLFNRDDPFYVELTKKRKK
jgi:hypothetical protein